MSDNASMFKRTQGRTVNRAGTCTNLRSNSQPQNMKLPIIEILDYLNSIVNPESSSKQNLVQSIVDLLKRAIGADWIEIYLEKKGKLKLQGSCHDLTMYELDKTDNLPAYVFSIREPVTINNPHTSLLLNGFKTKTCSMPGFIINEVKLSSILAMPLIDKNSNVHGCIQLYNKLDDNKCLSFFTENDIQIVSSTSKLFIEILKSYKTYSHLKKQVSHIEMLKRNEDSLWESSHQIFNQYKDFYKLIELLESKPNIDKNILKAISKLVNCQSIGIAVCFDNQAEIVQSYGKETQFDAIINLMQFTVMIKQKLLNVQDISIEPLVNANINFSYTGCLIIPIYPISAKQYAICLLREASHFSSNDEKICLKIKEKLEAFDFKIKIGSTLSNKQIKKMISFSLSDVEYYNFYALFNKIKEKAVELISANSCSIYVLDQNFNRLWTTNSSSSSSLFFPYSSKSLIGYTCLKRQIVMLPSEDSNKISDGDIFKNKFVLSIPLLSQVFENPVIGVLLCIRRDENFKKKEIDLITKYSECVSKILVSISQNTFEGGDTFDPTNKMELSISSSPRTTFRELNYRPENLTVFKEKSNLNINPFLNNLIDIICNPSAKFAGITKAFETFKNIKNPIELLNYAAQVGGCKKAVFYLIYDYNYRLVNKVTEEVIEADEIMKKTLYEKTYFFTSDIIQNGPLRSIPEQAFVLLGSSFFSSLNLYVPILNLNNSAIGLLHLSDFNGIIKELDIQNLQTLSTILGLSYVNNEPKLWESISERNHNLYLLQQWSKIIIEVAQSSIGNIIICKKSILVLSSKPELDITIKNAMSIIAACMNCSRAYILFEKNNDIIKYSSTGSALVPFKQSILDKIKRVSEMKVMQKSNSNNLFTLYIPFNYKNIRGYLKVSNNSSTLGKRFINDSSIIENLILKFCKHLGIALSQSEEYNDTIEQLLHYLKIIAFKFNPTAFFLALHNAAKSISDSERAIIFEYIGGKLIVPEQGADLEIPPNYELEGGTSIAYDVFTKGKSEILADAYSDKRFDPSIDKLTAYKTISLLCVPLEYNGKKFGIIQVINKRTGGFSENDKVSMEKFVETVCVMFEIIMSMQKTLEERYRLLAVTSYIEKYIFVFNEKTKLVFCSKPPEGIIGVCYDELVSMKYHEWMHINPVLLNDFESVIQNPDTNIKKTLQKIHSFSNEDEIKEINYRIAHLNYFSPDCLSGIILVIEDFSTIKNLYRELKNVRQGDKPLVSPIKTETKLKRTIQELINIKSLIENEEIKSKIEEVVSTLQIGRLRKSILIETNDKNIKNVVSLLGIPNELTIPISPKGEMVSIIIRQPSKVISLEILRDWELNVFEIENQFDYIFSMLSDFDLINHYQINENYLYSFLSRIKEKCNYWTNPFHNFNHCFNVMHGVYLLLSCTPSGSYFSSMQILALLISAICHDVDHRGKSNMFEVNSRSHIANTYHDKSVLERHHAAVTFFTLNENGCDIFSNFSRENYMAIRKMIISAILATDMAKHLHMIDEITVRFKELGEKPFGTLENDANKLADLIIHCGDLFHPCKPYEMYEVWSALVCQEFSVQYKEEIETKIPPTPFMKDLEKPNVYYGNEIGFLTYVIRPLWQSAQMIMSPHIDKLVENIDSNINSMKEKLEQWKKIEGNN
ncbi:hypothetical protein SteCoe_12152 [Stentor coeruleus]|uniref:Phosphodiesterase n=1 Tax=Stentor coeruleus TaxID=5963 RepID=A0A1R2CBI5_9CILI|nr:hypothetical protein SteCoe_12152 [Stentor coeruleus]